ncbi:MAG: ribbon-helix-helix domain-containing protein [Candidatus Obscuribacterales bacterium]|jgi:metal-responsive CopG/Arc/MetJ family transcriptional regulator|nr:ribbon-helix-helix domain-containing protein [Candidatus Obscuribacterales bacterium]
MPKKVLVALPVGMLEQVDFVAQVEHRTRSDLIREALRRYLEGFRRGSTPQPQPQINGITILNNDAQPTPA